MHLTTDMQLANKQRDQQLLDCDGKKRAWLGDAQLTGSR